MAQQMKNARSPRGVWMEEHANDYSKKVLDMMSVARINLEISEDKRKPPCVLVFPSLSDLALRLTQLVIKRSVYPISKFVTFEIGHGEDSRLVICHETVIDDKFNLDMRSTDALLAKENVTCEDRDDADLIPRTIIEKYVQPCTDDFWTPLSESQLVHLFEVVGEVHILKPAWFDFGYDMQITIDEKEYGHMVEVFDFNSDLKDADIKHFLRDLLQESDFWWVDDTHAILIFEDESKTHPALAFRHEKLKVRPITVASKRSKLKAINHQPVKQYLPPKPRPKTVSVIARRLIEGHLGLAHSPTTQKEKEILKKAEEDRQNEKELKSKFQNLNLR